MTFVSYYWISFAVTLVSALYVPTKLGRADNVIGSLLTAMLGFVLWPFALVAALKSIPQHSREAGNEKE